MDAMELLSRDADECSVDQLGGGNKKAPALEDVLEDKELRAWYM